MLHTRRTLSGAINFPSTINNCNFSDFVNEIYPPELKLKNVTATHIESSYLDTKINSGKGTEGIKTSIYDKREYLTKQN